VAHCTRENCQSVVPNQAVLNCDGGEEGNGTYKGRPGILLGLVNCKKSFFREKGIVPLVHLDSVWWLRYKRAISGHPKRSVQSSPSRLLAGAA
jgi:hypothetical protein